jgi:hypothetical protein
MGKVWQGRELHKELRYAVLRQAQSQPAAFWLQAAVGLYQADEPLCPLNSIRDSCSGVIHGTWHNAFAKRTSADDQVSPLPPIPTPYSPIKLHSKVCRAPEFHRSLMNGSHLHFPDVLQIHDRLWAEGRVKVISTWKSPSRKAVSPNSTTVPEMIYLVPLTSPGSPVSPRLPRKARSLPQSR